MALKIVQKLGEKLSGASKAATTVAKENSLKSLIREAKKGMSQKQGYRLSKKIINRGFKQAATRAATVAAISKNYADAKSNVAKYNYQSYVEALDRYNKVINQDAQPAEGTGNPESPQNNPTEVTPVGNS